MDQNCELSVTVIVKENEIVNPSSNPGRDSLSLNVNVLGKGVD